MSVYRAGVTHEEERLRVDLAHHTAERAKLLKDAGIKINVWTVDTLEEAQQMIDFGVDYITSNIVE